MEPTILFARTSDGVSIAYTTTGEGPPVLYCAALPSISMQSRLLVDPISPSRELAASTRLTDFDHAGIGASQRDVGDFSLDAQVRAIEAVAARLADDPFTLVANGTGSASAALYAIRHPSRVRALACVNPALVPMERMVTEMRENWSLYRRRFAGLTFPDGPVATQRWFSTAMRESSTAEVAAAYAEEYARADLREIFRIIPVPTLLCVTTAGSGREASLALASLVPDGRLAVVNASGDRGGFGAAATAAILGFMGIDAVPANADLAGETSTPASLAAPSGIKAILFTDIADSTALTERMGDAAFRSTARALDERMRSAITGAGGSAVDGKLLGDGVMAVFTSAAQAIEAAQRCNELSAESELRLHIGLHAGDAIHEGGNVYGGAVNIAARVCALSAPGEILVSSTMRELARTSADATFEDRGEHHLKGIDDAVRVYAVG